MYARIMQQKIKVAREKIVYTNCSMLCIHFLLHLFKKNLGLTLSNFQVEILFYYSINQDLRCV